MPNVELIFYPSGHIAKHTKTCQVTFHDKVVYLTKLTDDSTTSLLVELC